MRTFQPQGTKRVTLMTLTVGPDSTLRSTLLEDRLRVEATARVKAAAKEETYCWVAKVLRVEAEAANRARFQGTLETEVNFYQRLVPQLRQLGAPLPLLPSMVHSDCKTLNR